MDSYVFNQTGNGNVQIGDMTGMPYQVSTALKWALEHNFQSVAAQYSRTLALEVVRLREDSERTSAELKSARKSSGEKDDEIAALRAENDAFKADIEAGRVVRLPCGVGDTVYRLGFSGCRNGETMPDSSGCCGCEDECDMKRIVLPVKMQTLHMILHHICDFDRGWYFTTEEAAHAALEGE